jgi:hypothetical protein
MGMNNLPTEIPATGKFGTADFYGNLVNCLGNRKFRGTVTFRALGDVVSITEIRITEGSAEVEIVPAAEDDQPTMPRNFHPDWVDKFFSPFETSRLAKAWHERMREWVAHFGGDFHFHAPAVRLSDLDREARRAVTEYYRYRRLTGARA